jgi:hypothetical protein
MTQRKCPHTPVAHVIQKKTLFEMTDDDDG